MPIVIFLSTHSLSLSGGGMGEMGHNHPFSTSGLEAVRPEPGKEEKALSCMRRGSFHLDWTKLQRS